MFVRVEKGESRKLKIILRNTKIPRFSIGVNKYFKNVEYWAKLL